MVFITALFLITSTPVCKEYISAALVFYNKNYWTSKLFKISSGDTDDHQELGLLLLICLLEQVLILEINFSFLICVEQPRPADHLYHNRHSDPGGFD